MTALAELKFELVKSDPKLEELQHLCLELDGHRSEMIELAATALQKVIRAGELLKGFKDKTGHGKWLPWLEENLTISVSTSANWIRIYNRSKDDPKFADSANLPAYKVLKMIADTNSDGTPKPKKKRGKGGGGKKGGEETTTPTPTTAATTETQSNLGLESKPGESKLAETLEFTYGPDQRFTISKPLPTWRVINSPGFSQEPVKRQQAMLCTQCWCYMTSGALNVADLAAGVKQYRFRCDCKDSERDASSEKIQKQTTKKKK